MCTVTFIPVNGRYYLTSNRDEQHTRSKAVVPQKYGGDKAILLCPKDKDAGGTWIVAAGNGNATVLLNGAFHKHIPQPPYRKSRGLIVLEIMQSSSPLQQFRQLSLQQIEPFTLVLFSNRKLFECRWDGTQKHCILLPANRAWIWSSATLYNEVARNKRAAWFKQWRQLNPTPSAADVLHFHRFTGEGDRNNDLVMNRSGNTFTVSITSISIEDTAISMNYLDLQDQQQHYLSMNIPAIACHPINSI